jgi:ABC-type amino acid transport system permease subunit
MPGAIAFEFPELFFGGFWLTVQISVLGLIGAIILGTVIALTRVSPIAPLRWIGAAYV